MLERAGPGGQAGSSMRIENYLGFPTGISGSEKGGSVQSYSLRPFTVALFRLCIPADRRTV